MTSNSRIFIVLFGFCVLFNSCSNKKPEYAYWFDKPATYFEEAFPLGNGFIGMMVRGGAPSEELILNESSLWCRRPVDPNMNPDAWQSCKITGLRTRGGYTADQEWKNGRLKKAVINSESDGPVRLRYIDKTLTLNLSSGSRTVISTASFK